MGDNDNWNISSEDDNAWGEMFSDELDRNRWQTNFGKTAENAEQSAYWRDMVPNIEPSVASIYHKEGLTPYEITDYHTAGITDYKDILNWKRANAQPETASAFKEKGINPENYKNWASVGVTDVNQVVHFGEDLKIDFKQLEQFVKPLIDKELITLSEVPNWITNGFDIREIGPWLDAGFKYSSIAAGWRKLRFKPEEAIKWAEVLQRPSEAAKWLAGGYKKIEDIQGLIKQGYESPEEIEDEAENVVIKTK